MRRVLFRWKGVTVWSYPAMLYIGLVAGVVAGNRAAHATGADAFRVFAATFLLLPPALAGARLLYVASHWKDYKEAPGRVWKRSEGGLAMYGAMPVMLLLSVPVLAALGLGFGAFWDAASFTILTGIAITKIGCLLNGCCAGRPSRSSFAFTLPNARGVREQRIPVQCLEAAWAAIVLGAACALLGRLPFPGASVPVGRRSLQRRKVCAGSLARARAFCRQNLRGNRCCASDGYLRRCVTRHSMAPVAGTRISLELRNRSLNG